MTAPLTSKVATADGAAAYRNGCVRTDCPYYRGAWHDPHRVHLSPMAMRWLRDWDQAQRKGTRHDNT